MIDLGELNIGVKVDDSEVKELDKSLSKVGDNAEKSAKKTKDAWKNTEGPFKTLASNIKEKATKALDELATKAPKVASAIKGIGNAASTVGSGISSAFKGTIAVVEGVGKACVAAATAATAAIAGIAKQSLEQYGELEQLQGGAEKIFGDASNIIEENSKKAAKSMGITQQEYLDQSLSMGSALVKSLGGDTEKAAEYTDKAMKQMADNASVFGTDMEQVQNAYKGFAKGNYTMLDNLKLGYAGTKEGMEELLADAQKISGVKYDINNYDEVIDALQVIQDEQHITGNAAEEASKTIDGSINTLKASWSNMVTSLMDPNADPRVMFVNLTEAAQNVVNNVTPFIMQLLDTLKTMLPLLITQLVSMIDQIATDVLPPLLDAALLMLESVGASLMNNIDKIIDVVFNIISKLAEFLANNIGPILLAIANIITKLAQKITDNMPKILKTIGKILVEVAKALIKAIPDLAKSIVDMVKSLGETIWNNRHLIVEKFKEVFLSAKDAIMEAARTIWDGVKSLFKIGKDDVTVEGGTIDSSNNSGLYRVPYDGYLAQLHAGERVLTSGEAMNYNRREASAQVNQTFNITVPSNDNAMETALRLRELTRREAMGYANI